MFSEIEQIIGNGFNTTQTLDSIERRQEEISFQIEVMSRKVGEGNYTHELSDHLEEYASLKTLVMELES